MAKSVQITFKESEKELLKWLLQKRNRSCYIKDLLQDAKDKEMNNHTFLKMN